LIVAGLAIVSTPPALFAIERLNDALGLDGGRKAIKKQEHPKPAEAEDVLPNLLKPKILVKGNAGDKDVPPKLLKTKNVMQGNVVADEKEDQKPQLGEARVLLPHCLLEGSTINKASLVSEPSSPKSSSHSTTTTTTTAETEPKPQFSIYGIVEHDANNPYLLKIPGDSLALSPITYRLKQDNI
jgi:hypothetical protein